MGINKAYVRIALLLIAILAYPAERRESKRGRLASWKQGRLVSVETVASPGNSERRYECVVSDTTFSYTMQYEHPIKALVHGPIKFAIENNMLILVDADGEERPAHIEKRERVLLDSPNSFQNSK